MNLLHRVFSGRVAKPHPVSTDQHKSNTPRASSWSPTQPRRIRSPSPRAGSAMTAPSIARVLSTQREQRSQIEVAFAPKIRIKEEDAVEALTVAPARDEHLDFLSINDQPDGNMATDKEPNESVPLAMSVKRESNEGGSFERNPDDEVSLRDDLENADQEQSDQDNAVDELIATGTDYSNRDNPIPSIEEDDRDVEERERPRSWNKTPPFLHGATHRPARAPGSNSGNGLDEELEDEDFEEELGGEVEQNLLIDDSDLRYWLHHKRSTVGVENWPSEACRLYKLLFLRGLYPMFGSQWTWNFLDHPMPGELFTPLDSDDKCLLRTEKSDYHASKALIRLFNLHGYVRDYRQCGNQKKIASLIEKEIKRYVLWAERDGDLVKKLDYVSPVFVITYKDAQTASTGHPIVQRCQALVEKYRSLYAARGIREYPRCIYIFIVVQHIVLVMVADTEHPDDEEPYPLAELDLSQRSHWLDYSLGIAITVMLAKESLLAHRWAFPTIEVADDDPDL